MIRRSRSTNDEEDAACGRVLLVLLDDADEATLDDDDTGAGRGVVETRDSCGAARGVLELELLDDTETLGCDTCGGGGGGWDLRDAALADSDFGRSMGGGGGGGGRRRRAPTEAEDDEDDIGVVAWEDEEVATPFVPGREDDDAEDDEDDATGATSGCFDSVARSCDSTFDTALALVLVLARDELCERASKADARSSNCAMLSRCSTTSNPISRTSWVNSPCFSSKASRVTHSCSMRTTRCSSAREDDVALASTTFTFFWRAVMREAWLAMRVESGVNFASHCVTRALIESVRSFTDVLTSFWVRVMRPLAAFSFLSIESLIEAFALIFRFKSSTFDFISFALALAYSHAL